MKKYIDFNTEKRMNTANGFQKYFFKLIINSVYGKTMKNLRKKIKVRLVNSVEDILKYTSKPKPINHKIFGKDYAAIHKNKPGLIFNKPIYVGFTALYLSKWKIYGFHYNFIKNNFDADLLFTDTGSLTYEIKSENFYEEIFKWKDLFDFSNYSKDSKIFDEINKKILGKMEDEFSGVIVIEFVELKSKTNSMKKLKVKNVIQQKECVLQLSLINSNMFYLINKSLDTKRKEFKAKSIN